MALESCSMFIMLTELIIMEALSSASCALSFFSFVHHAIVIGVSPEVNTMKLGIQPRQEKKAATVLYESRIITAKLVEFVALRAIGRTG